MVSVSASFRKKATRAIWAIVLFVIVYLLLITLATILAVLCCYFGVKLIVELPGILTLAAGIGLAGMGLLVLFFLVKFVFKNSTVDRTGFIEIIEAEQPRLFSFIKHIADKVETQYPHKVFLSADVNASVSYEAGFWSMFFPSNKNLTIGLALVNAISVDEFRAILAHEFGHFSQKSMKVGAYVYNVNKVIFNMLFENDSYSKIVEKLNAVGGPIALFTALGVKIVQGIQWILRQVYTVVNVSYMALSREMEFHADEVAANVAGSRPLVASLLRMNLVDEAYNRTLDFYNARISEAKTAENIFGQHQFVLHYTAKDNQLLYENGWPEVSLQLLSRFNKSKLIIKDQWASHPNLEDRVANLQRLNIAGSQADHSPANSLFTDIDGLQRQLTQKVFSVVTYEQETSPVPDPEFETQYVKDREENRFGDVFNGYYDYKNPPSTDFSALNNVQEKQLSAALLFSDSMVDKIYTAISIEQDMDTVKRIESGEFKVKYFDYDGNKYHGRDAGLLVPQMEKELAVLKHDIEANDYDIARYFLNLARRQGTENSLMEKYQALNRLDNEYEADEALHRKIAEATEFVTQTTPFDMIEQKIAALKPVEEDFKKKLVQLLDEEGLKAGLPHEVRAVFEKYLSRDWVYFVRPAYDDSALEVLFTPIRYFPFLLSRRYFLTKKSLLTYFEECIKKNHA